MPKLATDRAAQEEIEKMSLAQNRFDIASENVQDEQVPEKMPRAAIQQRRGHELPGVSVVNSAIAQRQIIADEPGFECVEKKLGNETGDVESDQPAQNNVPAFLPRPRKQG